MSMVRSSSPQPATSLTLNYSDNNAPKEKPSPKKTRAYKRKNTVSLKPLIEQNVHKKKLKQKKKTNKWFAGKDNNFVNSVPSQMAQKKLTLKLLMIYLMHF